ncbi:MAG: ABC transporter permease [Prevotella sp.]|nr:ABC transporter permease [Bacteroides sp.]MCM1366549.1 ABC transporter permease [Prevotella sp.]MCM1436859.1 ABC transporter permease [Prevotella sp.]
MSWGLSARIALRYLFSRKSHSAVSAISAVSVVGVAIATAALVCVLSVFNGFKDVLGSKLDLLSPDVIVEPAKGNLIMTPDSLLQKLKSVDGIAQAMPVVQDNALGVYEGREMPVTVKGVNQNQFRKMTSIDSIMLEGGRFAATSQSYISDEDEYGETEERFLSSGTVAIGVASRLSIYDMGSKMTLFTPRKGVRINQANPLASFVTDSICVEGVYQANQSEYDDNFVITDIETARRLFELSDEATAIEIKGKPGVDPTKLAEKVRKALPVNLKIKDKLQQQEINFRMIEIEKWVTFLLLFFILLIAGFNLVSTLSMLVLEKQHSLSTLHSLGMTRSRIGKVFAWESVMVTFFGGASGIILGVTLCLLQERYGFIKLNGDPDSLMIQSYPVVLEWPDLPMVCIPLVVIGTLTAAVSARFAKRKLQ